jgi:outer membrane protein
MRNVFTTVFAVAGLAVLAAPAAAQAPKLGYVDSGRIIAEAPGAKEAQATFEKDMDRYRAQLKSMEDSLKTMMSDYEAKQVMLSPEAKKTREDAIREKQGAYQQRASQLEDQANRRQNELVEPIMRKINAVLMTIRKEGGYSIIFDVSKGGVVAADSAYDLSAEVLRRLNLASTAAAPAAPAPSAPALGPRSPVRKP